MKTIIYNCDKCLTQCKRDGEYVGLNVPYGVEFDGYDRYRPRWKEVDLCNACGSQLCNVYSELFRNKIETEFPSWDKWTKSHKLKAMLYKQGKYNVLGLDMDHMEVEIIIDDFLSGNLPLNDYNTQNDPDDGFDDDEPPFSYFDVC